MAGNFFEIDTGILDQNADEITQQFRTMTEILRDLLEQITEMDAMWDGPASEAFKLQFTKDCEVYKAYCKEMWEYIDCLKYASKQYNLSESKVRAAIDAIHIG